MEYTKSQRIVQALQQLDQFQPYIWDCPDKALHVINGTVITAYTEDGVDDSGIIKIQFPGGPEHDVVGEMYLKLQILESAAHEMHADGDSKSPIAQRANELIEHLWRKHGLD